VFFYKSDDNLGFADYLVRIGKTKIIIIIIII